MRLRTEFERFTGRDGGKTLLAAMRVWAEASHLPPATFRRLVVGPAMTEAGAAALQAMGRTLATPDDPAGLADAGPQLATALTQTGRNGLGYSLSYAQDKALYADANGLVPDCPAGKDGAVAATALAGGRPFVVTLPTAALPKTLLLALRVGAA